MGRIIGLALMVAAIYFAVTTYQGEGKEPGEQRSTAQRAGAAVEDAFAEGAARREALLPE